jgi:acyl-CoA synthetase (AMP-forming)/AMP-acid ligase II
MQDVPLTAELVLQRARRARTVVTATPYGPRTHTWAELVERALRLRAALKTLGVQPGDRVATFARNCQLNIRLHRDQLEYIVAEAEDRVLFVDPSLTAEAEWLTDRVVVMDDGYEDLLAAVRDHRRAPGPRAARRERLLPPRAVPGRLAAHRRPRQDRPRRHRPSRRPRQRPRQVRWRVDQLGPARERDRGASGGPRGGGDRDRVAKWWIPERIEFVDAIPRTAVGKYDKRALRDRHRAPG